MIKILNCRDFLDNRSVCIDVRSPSEFNESAVIGAQNLPLLNDENRKAIGICYKQKGKDAAIALGYELVNPIRHTFLEDLNRMTETPQVKIYCARGGLRSSKMAEFLNASGYDVSVLKGGYKAYRNLALDTISGFSNIFILAGNTGCGKTEILGKLNLHGEQTLDLEKLANHKGSAFGALGEQPQPTNSRFSNLIFEHIRHYRPEKRLWVESESFKIGKVALPDELWKNMVMANGIEIVIPLDKRAEYIIGHYGKYPKEDLKASVNKLGDRLDRTEIEEMCERIDKNDLYPVVARLLKYYDKGYKRSREKTNCKNFVKFNLESTDAMINSGILLQHLQKSKF